MISQMIYQMLLGMVIISLAAYIIYKFVYYRSQAAFWKDSCYVIMEKYNNLLVQKSANDALDQLSLDRKDFKTELN